MSGSVLNYIFYVGLDFLGQRKRIERCRSTSKSLEIM